jgi:hypothetical protein
VSGDDDDYGSFLAGDQLGQVVEAGFACKLDVQKNDRGMFAIEHLLSAVNAISLDDEVVFPFQGPPDSITGRYLIIDDKNYRTHKDPWPPS